MVQTIAAAVAFRFALFSCGTVCCQHVAVHAQEQFVASSCGVHVMLLCEYFGVRIDFGVQLNDVWVLKISQRILSAI